MSMLSAYIHTFEGQPFPTIMRDGSPCWLARSVGLRLGYGERGADLIRGLRGPWASALVEGVHFDRLTPNEHAAVDVALAQAGLRPVGDDPVVLYPAGLWFVVGRTEAPVAPRLGDFVRTVVLPHVAPERPKAPTLTRLARALRSPDAERLDRVIDLLDRHMQVTALHRVIDRAGSVLGEAGCAALEVLAAEIATNEDLRAAINLASSDGAEPTPAA
jgi:hypothetical protein